MSDRFFSEVPIEGPVVELAGSEAHHLAHVLRAEPGRRVVLFDGLGAEYDAVVEWIGRRAVRVRVEGRREGAREWPLRVSLAVALPKGERQRWLVEKCVELGLARLVPLRTARSAAEPTDAALARLRRAVVEASKQCGRNRLMRIDPPRQWLEWAATAPARCCRLIAQPGGTDSGAWLPTGPAPTAALAENARAENAPREVDVQLAVGPEGGWTDEELAAARASGWRSVDLGPTILRVETAAVAMVAQLAAEWRLRR